MQPDLVFGRTVFPQSAELLDWRAPALHDRVAKRRTDSERRWPEYTGFQGYIELPGYMMVWQQQRVTGWNRSNARQVR